jgi:hypothetical protein
VGGQPFHPIYALPLADQHTDELLSEILGLSKDDVATLLGRRIVGG